jgi:hypothetical protein
MMPTHLPMLFCRYIHGSRSPSEPLLLALRAAFTQPTFHRFTTSGDGQMQICRQPISVDGFSLRIFLAECRLEGFHGQIEMPLVIEQRCEEANHGAFLKPLPQWRGIKPSTAPLILS